MDIYDFYSSIQTQSLFSVEEFQRMTLKMKQEGFVMFIAGILVAKVGLFQVSSETNEFLDKIQDFVPLIESGEVSKKQFLRETLQMLQKIQKLIRMQNHQNDCLFIEKRINCGKKLLKIADQTVTKMLHDKRQMQELKKRKVLKNKLNRAQQKETIQALNMILQQWKQFNPNQQKGQQKIQSNGINLIEQGNKELRKSKQNLCDLCKKSIQQALTTSCNHHFHTVCLSKYVQRNISRKGSNLNCPKRNCNKIFSLEQVKTLIKDDNELIQYLQVEKRLEPQLNQVVKRQCPTATCSAVFELNPCRFRYKCTQCLKDYCMSCRSIYHVGKTCEQYCSRMKIKFDVGSGNSRRKKLQLKECPKCKFWVEKVSGVNCLQCKCGVEFCLKCGGTACQREMCFGSGYKKRNKV